VCTHLKVEVDEGQLEVELVTSRMVQLWRPWVQGKVFRGLKNVWLGLRDYLKDQG